MARSACKATVASAAASVVFQANTGPGTGSDGQGFRAVQIECDSSSVANLEMTVEPIDSSAVTIYPGAVRNISLTDNRQVTKITLSGSSGTATYSFFQVS